MCNWWSLSPFEKVDTTATEWESRGGAENYPYVIILTAKFTCDAGIFLEDLHTRHSHRVMDEAQLSMQSC